MSDLFFLITPILALPLFFFVAVPPAALLIGIGFLFIWKKDRKLVKEFPGGYIAFWELLAGFVWLGYGVYESYMWVWSQNVSGPIRIDLFFVAVPLWIATVLGIVNTRTVRRKYDESRKTPEHEESETKED